jgi:hypothetical protein
MKEDDTIEALDWQRIFSPDFFPPGYVGEIAVRTAFMFIFLIILLKFSVNAVLSSCQFLNWQS